MSQFDAKSCIMLTQTLWVRTMRTVWQRRPPCSVSAPHLSVVGSQWVILTLSANCDPPLHWGLHNASSYIFQKNSHAILMYWWVALVVIRRNKQAISCIRETTGRNFNGYQDFILISILRRIITSRYHLDKSGPFLLFEYLRDIIKKAWSLLNLKLRHLLVWLDLILCKSHNLSVNDKCWLAPESVVFAAGTGH